MKTLILILLSIMGTKLIEDNLPNMHYKNIINGFNTLLAILYIYLLGTVISLTKDPERKRTLQHYLITIAAACVVVNILSRRTKQNLGTPQSNEN